MVPLCVPRQGFGWAPFFGHRLSCSSWVVPNACRIKYKLFDMAVEEAKDQLPLNPYSGLPLLTILRVPPSSP